MAVLLCRCCGARLEYKQGMSVVKCDYCDVQQTIPILDFDEKALQWERAEQLRRSGEYDRAMVLYEQIAQLSPDDPDIYWSEVLCRYGVEYVEEPVSHKRIPTINRIQYTSVIDDPSYRRAVKLAADGDQRRIYILQAQALDELRRNILSVSLSEKPYDIFICYKESDSNGRRTEDSALAAGLYRSLTAEGWRVFFARVTLENKAGTEFEPYIFAALNSAKIMLVVGTSPDNMNAPWVKNEWSRYLARLNETSEGTLVPVYKGMFREHLPAEFGHLHAMDMSEPGFEEELIRGIHKILDIRNTVSERRQDVPTDVTGMLHRAEFFLEDRDFDRADELCEKALDCDPENSLAYVLKLLVEYHITSRDELHECGVDFTRSGNYAKAVRFGDEKMKSWLEKEAALAMNISAEAAEKRDADLKERNYHRARELVETADNRADLLDAESILAELNGYKDCSELLRRCNERISVLKNEDYSSHAAKQAAEMELAKRSRKRRRLTGASTVAACVLSLIGVAAKIANNMRRVDRYNAAHSISAEFDVASVTTSASDDYISAGYYEEAIRYFQEGKYDVAANLFEQIKGYKDSGEYAVYAKYNSAIQSEQNGKFNEAALKFMALGSFSDSPERARDCLYSEAKQLCEEGRFSESLGILEGLNGYKDSADIIKQAKYGYALSLRESGDYDEAISLFSELGTYSDSPEQLTECRNLKAAMNMGSGEA